MCHAVIHCFVCVYFGSNEEKKKMIAMLERLEEQYKDDETRSDSGGRFIMCAENHGTV